MSDTTWPFDFKYYIRSFEAKYYNEKMGEITSRDSLEKAAEGSAAFDIKNYVGYKKGLIISSQVPYNKEFRRSVWFLFSSVNITSPVFLKNNEYSIVVVQYPHRGTLWLLRQVMGKWQVEKNLLFWTTNSLLVN